MIGAKRIITLFWVMGLLSNTSFSQQNLTLQEAENQLQKKNLLILAEQFNLTASQAQVIQAKIWDQPYLTLDFNALNPQNNKTFDVGSRGQKAITVQQLIYLGGKKKNEVEFAKSNAVLAEIQFSQLLLNLKYQLRQTFYSYYFDQIKLNTLNKQIIILDELLSNYVIQSQKGNIPLKDVARLQSLVLGLKNDKIEIINSLSISKQNLALLVGNTSPITPVVDEFKIINKTISTEISKDEIFNTASQNNLDFLYAQKMSESQELNLKWQKSLSVGDLNAGIGYDQRGGAFNNQVNVIVGIPIQLWNKNRGNIKMAEAQLEQSKVNVNYAKLDLETKVESSINIWQQQREQWKSIDSSAVTNNNSVYEGMITNFQKRNITLLEFTDFMESYKQTAIQINEIKKSLIQSAMNINYITNKEIF